MRREDLRDDMVMVLPRDVRNPAYDRNHDSRLDRTSWLKGMLFVVRFYGDGTFKLWSPNTYLLISESDPGVGGLVDACEPAPLTFESIMLRHGVEEETDIIRVAMQILCDTGKITLDELAALMDEAGDLVVRKVRGGAREERE